MSQSSSVPLWQVAPGHRPPGRGPAQGGREGAGAPHPTHGHPLRAGAPFLSLLLGAKCFAQRYVFLQCGGGRSAFRSPLIEVFIMLKR